MHHLRNNLLAPICLTVFLLFLALAWLTPDRILFTNDGASTMAVAKGVFHSEFPQGGPPAARGGRHFAPWYFYWQLIFLSFSLGNVFWAIILEAAAKALLLGCGSWALLRTLSPRQPGPAAVIGLMAAFLAGSWWWVLRTPWHSNFIASVAWIPLLLCLLSIPAGGIPFPAVILAASLLLEAHLAASPLSLLCLAGAGLCAIASRTTASADSTQQKRRGPMYLFITLTALSWVPPLRLVFEKGGHLFGESQRAKAGVGLLRAAETTGTALFRFLFGDGNKADLFAPFPPVVALIAMSFGVFFLLLVILKAGSIIQRRWLIIAAAVLTYIFVISRLGTPIHEHYLHSIIIIAPVLLAVALAEATSLVQMAFSKTSEAGLGMRAAGAPAVLFLLVVLNVTVKAGGLTLAALQTPPFPRYQTLAHAEQVAAVLQQQQMTPRSSLLYINEANRYRESAVFFFLGFHYFAGMQYAKHFTELFTFQQPPPGTKERAFVLGCEGLPAARLKSLVASYTFNQDIPLEGCPTCTGCSLSEWRLKPELSGPAAAPPKEPQTAPDETE